MGSPCSFPGVVRQHTVAGGATCILEPAPDQGQGSNSKGTGVWSDAPAIPVLTVSALCSQSVTRLPTRSYPFLRDLKNL